MDLSSWTFKHGAAEYSFILPPLGHSAVGGVAACPLDFLYVRHSAAEGGEEWSCPI